MCSNPDIDLLAQRSLQLCSRYLLPTRDRHTPALALCTPGSCYQEEFYKPTKLICMLCHVMLTSGCSRSNREVLC